jgi:endonuclease YncB( thermonuclease family)
LCALALAPAQGSGKASTATTGRYPVTVHDCRVVDGDTLRCDIGRIRLLGIDAPELPGHCAQGRDCAPGNPYESSKSLADGMGDGADLRIRNVGTDRYGRTLAMVLGRGGDLSCWQLTRGEAIYKPRWDNDGLVAATCPAATR